MFNKIVTLKIQLQAIVIFLISVTINGCRNCSLFLRLNFLMNSFPGLKRSFLHKNIFFRILKFYPESEHHFFIYKQLITQKLFRVIVFVKQITTIMIPFTIDFVPIVNFLCKDFNRRKVVF